MNARLRWVIAAVVRLLLLPAACAGVQAAAEPVASVEVIPRIGLFNQIQYVRDRGEARPLVLDKSAWTPMDRAAFLEAVHESTREVIGKTLGNNWELLTTFDPARNYQRRKVRIVLSQQPEAAAISRCEAEFPGPHGARVVQGIADAKGCTVTGEVLSNAALQVRVWYGLGGGGLQPRPIGVDVPEDYLVVIAGDSYASGEGNPDRPCMNDTGFVWKLFGCANGPSLWMDEQCHRSFWSAGMRSALRLIHDDPAPRRRGAYTVVNVACSGAQIVSGLTSNYVGVRPLEKVVERHRRAVGAIKVATTGVLVPPQLQVVESLVGPRSGSGKDAIDLMILSAGGNDVEFGSVTLASIAAMHATEWFEQVEANLDDRLGEYGAALRAFSARLRAIPAELVLWVPYPDVTGVGQRHELTLHCAAGPLARVIGFEEGRFGIDSRERALAYRVLVTKLNGLNEQFASTQRIRMLSRSAIDGRFDNRGWCAELAGDGPYRPGQRLIRKVDESIAYQESVHGTMHPTYEAHEIVAGLIDRALRQAREEALDLRIVGEFADPATGRLWIKSPVRIALTGVPEAEAGKHEICSDDGQGFDLACRQGALDLTLDDGASTARPMLAVHATSKRRFRRTLPARSVDATPPVHDLCGHSRPKGLTEQCGSFWVLPGDTLSFTARDRGSGLATVTVRIKGVVGETVVPGKPVPGGVVIPAESLPSGTVELVVEATDRVGNASGVIHTVQVDRSPPVVFRIKAWGAEFGRERFDRLLPMSAGVLDLELAAADADSGVVSLGYSTGGDSLTVGDGSELAARTKACGTAGLRNETYVRRVRLHAVAGQLTALAWAQDCARQKSDAWPIRAVAARETRAPALPASDWARPGAINRDLARTVMQMTSLFGTLPSAADDAAFRLFAAWLNIADGRMPPAAAVAATVDLARCEVVSPGKGDAATVYALLIATEVCAATQLALRPQERELFLRRVADVLPGAH